MFELITLPKLNLKLIKDLLDKIGKLEFFMENFGTIEISDNINNLYYLNLELKKYNINTEIRLSKEIKTPVIKNIDFIDISERNIKLKEEIISFNEIKAITLHLIKKPSFKGHVYKINSIDDLFYEDILIYFNIITNTSMYVSDIDNIKFQFYNNLTSNEKIYNLVNFLQKINEKIIISPILKSYINQNNYIKYFVYDTFNNGEILWLIKTKQIDI